MEQVDGNSDDLSVQFSSNSSESMSSDSTDCRRLKSERPKRRASQLSFIDPDNLPSREPVLKVIKRPGKRGRPPRRWVYSDSDDVFFDDPKDNLVKRLSRNENEKMRRDRLNTYVAELAHLLPMVVAANRKMEKSSILRLAVNYLRVNNDFMKNGTQSESVWNFLDEDTINQLLQQCNGDFILASTKRGTIAFASDGLTNALGHKLVDVLGQTIFELIHPDDTELYMQQFKSSDSCKRQFSIRVLNNLSNDEQQFVLITFQGFIKTVKPLQSPFFKGKEDDSVYLIAIGKLPSCHQSIEDFKFKVPCSNSSYMVYHDAFGGIQYLDPRSALLTGFMPNELVGKDAYRLVLEEDQPLVAHSHYKLMTEDVVVTIYRAYNKVGSIHYLKTITHKVLHPWTRNIKYLISVNEIISEDTGKHLRKEFIQKKKVDELVEVMKTKIKKEAASPEVILSDSTISSTSQADAKTNGIPDSSDPYDIPCIRAYLPRLWDLCKGFHEETNEETGVSVESVSTSTKEEPDQCLQLSPKKDAVQNSSTSSDNIGCSDNVKHVPHRLRSLIRPVSHDCVTKPAPQRFKSCTKAYRSKKLNSLLSRKAKEKTKRLRSEKESGNDVESDPEPCSSSTFDNHEMASSGGHLLFAHRSSFCDHLANIKLPQLPLWTRQHDMRQESQSSLLYKMLKQMEDEEELSHGVCLSSGLDMAEVKPQEDSLLP